MQKVEEKDEIIKNYVIASNEFLSKAVQKNHGAYRYHRNF